MRYGLRPSRISPRILADEKRENRKLRNHAIWYSYPQLLMEMQRPALGQYSIGRVGQYSIGANNENVQVKSLALLKGELFRVLIFLGPNNTKLPVELVLAMQDLGDRAEYIVLETPGTNALDFHIAYYLGVIATTDPLGFFHIISKDTGFDPLIKHLKAKKVLSARSVSIEEMPSFVQEKTNGNGSTSGALEKKQKSTLVREPVDALIAVAINDLIKRQASKPRTSKTLFSTIHAKCGKEISVVDIKAVFEELVKRGYVKVNGAKVSYALPAA